MIGPMQRHFWLSIDADSAELVLQFASLLSENVPAGPLQRGTGAYPAFLNTCAGSPIFRRRTSCARTCENPAGSRDAPKISFDSVSDSIADDLAPFGEFFDEAHQKRFLQWRPQTTNSLSICSSSQQACTPNGTRCGKCSLANSFIDFASRINISALVSDIRRSSR
jgi:hypothetical protein